MSLQKIDIGNEFGRGWRLFQPNMETLVLAAVLTGVVSCVSLGLLLGPMTAGLLLVARRLLKNDPVKPQAGDVFKGFDYFGAAFLLFVIVVVVSAVLQVIPVLGQVAALLSGVVFNWAMMLVAFQKLSATDALKKVFEYTKSGEFTLPLVLALIASFISGLGVMVCIVGFFFTLPIATCLLVCCYETLFSGEPEVVTPPPDEAHKEEARKEEARKDEARKEE
jgi:hypothetical protein